VRLVTIERMVDRCHVGEDGGVMRIASARGDPLGESEAILRRTEGREHVCVCGERSEGERAQRG